MTGSRRDSYVWLSAKPTNKKRLGPGGASITVSQRYVHKLTESVERAMAAMEEANRKVGTIPAHVPVGDAGWLPPKFPAASGLQLPLAM